MQRLQISLQLRVGSQTLFDKVLLGWLKGVEQVAN
jgi:hypothetical protein